MRSFFLILFIFLLIPFYFFIDPFLFFIDPFLFFLIPTWCSNLGAEYPSPKGVNLFNYGRIINPKRLKVTYSATKIKVSFRVLERPGYNKQL